MGFKFSYDSFDFGPNFTGLIQLIYTDPPASVYTNSISSEYSPLHREMKQGDPASPLLFILAIEPLAIALRDNNSIQCISPGGLTHTVSLYTDGLLLYVTNPITTIPEILKILQNFGNIYGCKLNFDKSEYLLISSNAR